MAGIWVSAQQLGRNVNNWLLLADKGIHDNSNNKKRWLI